MNKKDAGLAGLTMLLAGMTYLNVAHKSPAKAQDLACEDLTCPSKASCGGPGTDDTKCNITCNTGSIIHCNPPL